jgi:glycosyltransferase involved in cell wall biosynthesis
MTLNVMFVLPGLFRAGAETQVVDLVNQIDPARVRAHLFTFEPYLDQLERLNRPQVTHHYVERRGKFDLAPARALGRLLDELEIDVLHCTLQFALLVGSLGWWFSRRRPRLSVAVHTTLNRTGKDDLLDRLLYQWLMRRCGRIVFVCDAQRLHWQRKFPFVARLAETVHNGIDVARFEPEAARRAGQLFRQQHGIAPDAIVMAHVAAFRPEKAHPIVLAALARLAPRWPQLTVVFAGDGPLRSSIEQQAAQMGLSAQVRFTGNVPDIRQVLGAADFSVLPSTAVETFSLAMLESLALEVPMVASDLGGAREAVLDGETGLIVAPGQVDALVAAVERLAGDPALRRRMGQAGRALVLSEFTRARMTAHTTELIEQLAQAPA